MSVLPLGALRPAFASPTVRRRPPYLSCRFYASFNFFHVKALNEVGVWNGQ